MTAARISKGIARTANIAMDAVALAVIAVVVAKIPAVTIAAEVSAARHFNLKL